MVLAPLLTFVRIIADVAGNRIYGAITFRLDNEIIVNNFYRNILFIKER